jgi:RNase P/RNase MRP subunit p30
MYVDAVLMSKEAEIESFGKKLGVSKIIFKEEFTKNGIVLSENYSKNRELIEKKKVKVLVNTHVNEEKDHLHFRSSGLNQVICELAQKNEIAFGFTFNSLNNPVLIGRFKQNIKLCRKYKVQIYFFTFADNKYGLRNPEDLMSLLKVFGMTGLEAKKALQFSI